MRQLGGCYFLAGCCVYTENYALLCRGGIASVMIAGIAVAVCGMLCTGILDYELDHGDIPTKKDDTP